MPSYGDALAKTGCENAETTRAKADNTFRGVDGS